MKKLIVWLSLLLLSSCVVGGNIGVGNSGGGVGISSGIAF